MAVVWSVLAGIIAVLVSRNRRTGLVIGLVAFSHWVVDFIAKPMTHVYPNDSGLPLLFGGSPTVGLGVWGTATGVYIGEYGTVILGLAIYMLTRIQLKNESRMARGEAL